MNRSLSLSRAGRTVYASPLLTLFAAAVFVIPGADIALRYVVDATPSDAWRFVASHWVHWSFEHLLWSGGAFLLLGWVCEARGRIRFLATTLAAALTIPLALRLAQPGLEHYGGLSGLDSALFGLLCMQDIRMHWRSPSRRRLAVPLLLLMGFLGKIGYEFATGAAVFVSHTDAMVPVPLAHLVGAAVGIIAALDVQRGFLWEKDAFRVEFAI